MPSALFTALHGLRLTGVDRRFLREENHVNTYEGSFDDDGREQAVDDARAALGRDRARREADLGVDSKWQLIRRLRAREAELSQHFAAPGLPDDERPFEPVELMGSSVELDREPGSQWVTLRFDHRLSQRQLSVQIKELWPSLAQRRLVRRTSKLGPRKAALVAFVCIELPPGRTWQLRYEGWNSTHSPLNGGYASARAFQREFRAAEKSITGAPYGLEHFYDPLSWGGSKELKAAARLGVRGAKRRLKRVERDTYAIVDAVLDDAVRSSEELHLRNLLEPEFARVPEGSLSVSGEAGLRLQINRYGWQHSRQARHEAFLLCRSSWKEPRNAS
jgi:hypothetical protein